MWRPAYAPLDYVAMKALDESTSITVDPYKIFLEVCLRCGTQYQGNIEELIPQRHEHLCDPANRKPIPEWAE